MAALPALASRLDYAALGRVGLLTLVVICVSGASTPPTARESRDAQVFVDAHNAIRADVERPPDYVGPWAPLPPVAWSDEIASGSQFWAEYLRDKMKCGLTHSDTRDGENLAAGKKVDAVAAVRMWAGEKDKFRYTPKYDFERSSGHYSQLVWRRTTHIGCARATCGRTAVVVCRYRPAGNHIGKAPF